MNEIMEYANVVEDDNNIPLYIIIVITDVIRNVNQYPLLR